MQIRAICSDLEGPIVCVDDLHFDGFIYAARKLGKEITFQDIKTIPDAIGGGDNVIARGIAKMFDREVDPDEIKHYKMVYYNRALRERDVHPRPGFLEFFSWVTKVKKLPFAIGSLTPTNQAEVLLERSGVSRLVPRNMTVLLEDVGEENKKPKPDVYLKTAGFMGVSPREQLGFEDSPPGLRALAAAGTPAIAMPIFRTPDMLHRVVDEQPLRIFADWREINFPELFQNLHSEI